jgi:hypothetical protein
VCDFVGLTNAPIDALGLDPLQFVPMFHQPSPQRLLFQSKE